MRWRLTLAALVWVGLAMILPGAALADTADPTPAPTASTGTAQAPPDGSYFDVTLVDRTDGGDGEPVADVTLEVRDDADELISEGVTDEDGRVYLPIPGGGLYTVVLDEDTLPDGVELDGSPELEKSVILDGRQALLFPIGTQEVESTPLADRVLQALANGTKEGLIIALAGLGLSLIFGTTGLTNFAHGEYVTFGAIATFFLNTSLSIPVIPAVVAAVVTGGLFGYLSDRALWRPLRRKGVGIIAMMIVSIGLSLFLRSVYQYLIGSQNRPLSDYVVQKRIDLGLFALTPKAISIIVICLVVITVVCVILMKTRMGKATRAVADNPALASATGINVDGVIRNVWILGATLTALAGALLAIDRQVSYSMGFNLLLLIFAGVTLGGLGTIWGALIGSLVIGYVVELLPLLGVPADLKFAGALVILIIILLVRPQGILGRAERIG
ncbi:branched-chain amino acid ABC transporter permease [Aeromicrobium sp. Leaf350]|uniref:branched-chain amino acid ABC transporter permease n=1 Tax=Aeromicrobium sp. Leaf350 TaxID=2876565 RepID=UPI001E575931|nr:branched-chain amino acid ABC transporter permease [Aeromicrobium sp. Leaf350]